MIFLVLVPLAAYLTVTASLIGPVRRIGFSEFQVMGWLGAIVVAGAWPWVVLRLLRRDFLLHILRSK